jgi:hypothetical protein
MQQRIINHVSADSIAHQTTDERPQVYGSMRGGQQVKPTHSTVNFPALDRSEPDYAARRDAALEACFQEIESHVAPKRTPLSDRAKKALLTPASDVAPK